MPDTQVKVEQIRRRAVYLTITVALGLAAMAYWNIRIGHENASQEAKIAKQQALIETEASRVRTLTQAKAIADKGRCEGQRQGALFVNGVFRVIRGDYLNRARTSQALERFSASDAERRQRHATTLDLKQRAALLPPLPVPKCPS